MIPTVKQHQTESTAESTNQNNLNHILQVKISYIFPVGCPLLEASSHVVLPKLIILVINSYYTMTLLL